MGSGRVTKPSLGGDCGGFEEGDAEGSVADGAPNSQHMSVDDLKSTWCTAACGALPSTVFCQTRGEWAVLRTV